MKNKIIFISIILFLLNPLFVFSDFNASSLIDNWSNYTNTVVKRSSVQDKIIKKQDIVINKYKNIITIQSNILSYKDKEIKSTKIENWGLKIIIAIFTAISIWKIAK